MGIKNDRNRLWYIRNQWITTLSLSKGKTSNQIIKVRGNVKTTKQMPINQTIIDLIISIITHFSSAQLCEPSVALGETKNLRTDTEIHREVTERHREGLKTSSVKITN